MRRPAWMPRAAFASFHARKSTWLAVRAGHYFFFGGGNYLPSSNHCWFAAQTCSGGRAIT
jgi:hypothetical protein